MLKKLQDSLGSHEVQLWGKIHGEKASDDWVRIIPHSLVVRCAICRNIRLVLTDQGQKFVELVRAGVSKSGEDHIPF